MKVLLACNWDELVYYNFHELSYPYVKHKDYDIFFSLTKSWVLYLLLLKEHQVIYKYVFF